MQLDKCIQVYDKDHDTSYRDYVDDGDMTIVFCKLKGKLAPYLPQQMRNLDSVKDGTYC